MIADKTVIVDRSYDFILKNQVLGWKILWIKEGGSQMVDHKKNAGGI